MGGIGDIAGSFIGAGIKAGKFGGSTPTMSGGGTIDFTQADAGTL